MQNGTNILKRPTAEVTDISPFGIWVLVNNEEYYICYRDFPFFENAPIKSVAALEADSEGNLHWADLDVDIELDSLKAPDKYPLIYHN